MKAIILAAGYATRLYPLTQNTPKSLLEVAGIKIIDRLCAKIAQMGPLTELVIVTNDRFYDQLMNWKKSVVATYPFGKITILNDKTTSNENRLGAMGDLYLTLQTLDIKEDIFFFASDNLFEESLEKFREFVYKEKTPCMGVYDIQDKSLASGKYGVIEFDSNYKVVNMQEKPLNPCSSYIGVGVYFLPANDLKFVSEYLQSEHKQDAPGFFFSWLHTRQTIKAYPFKGLWYDIGDLESLNDAHKIFSQKINI